MIRSQRPRKGLSFRWRCLSLFLFLVALVTLTSLLAGAMRRSLLRSQWSEGVDMAKKLGIRANSGSISEKYCLLEDTSNNKCPILPAWDDSMPDPVLPILMPVYGRPEYLSEVLEALLRVHNINKTFLVISQDGHNPEVQTLIKRISQYIPTIHLYHVRPYLSIPSFYSNEYATGANVKALLTFAYEYLGVDGTIVIEDDIKPGVDMYDYFVWTHKYVMRNPEYRRKVLNINSFNMDSRAGADPYELFPYQFTVWGWSTSKDWWALLRDNWTWLYNWDWTVQATRKSNNLVSLSPSMSRVQNIGMKGVNFKVSDDQLEEWKAVYISDVPILFDVRPRVSGRLEFK